MPDGKINMTKVIGIDASLAGTGICSILLAGEETHVSKTITASGDSRGVDRLIDIRDQICQICSVPSRADLVVIEGYAHDRGNRAHYMGELGGVLRVLLTELKIKWVEVAPAQVKKFATGKGNASKEVVAVGVYKKWRMEFPDNNQCDAYVLARIGAALCGRPGEPLRDYQMEVIAALQGKKAPKPKQIQKPKNKGATLA